jgi:hypothetical protein
MASSVSAAAFNLPLLAGTHVACPSTHEACIAGSSFDMTVGFDLYRIMEASSKLSRGLRGYSLLGSP